MKILIKYKQLLLIAFLIFSPSIVLAAIPLHPNDSSGGGTASSTTPEVGRVSSNLSTSRLEDLWNNLSIPVCWENATANNSRQREWTRDAVERSWDAVSNIDFIGWRECDARTTGIRIQIADENPHTKGLGKQLAGKPQGMVLNFDFRNWSPTCAQPANNEYCIRTIAVHEFGHALGFAHEHNRADRDLCTEEPQGPNPTIYITAYDRDSIMNYCPPSNSGWSYGSLSTLDVAGVRMVYGPFDDGLPARVKVEGSIYIVDHESIVHDQTGTKPIEHEFALTNTQPQQEVKFDYCVGGEVRVELKLKAALVPNTNRVNLNSQASLFEGDGCDTNDFETSDQTSVDIVPTSAGSNTPNTSTRLLLNNPYALGGGDAGAVNLVVTSEAVELRSLASGCVSCASASKASNFLNTNPTLSQTVCQTAVQNRIAWDYEGHKTWNIENINKLCKNAESSQEPAKCFDKVMHGNIKWDASNTRWNWVNAINLCKGSRNHQKTIDCFTGQISNRQGWEAAIKVCNP